MGDRLGSERGRRGWRGCRAHGPLAADPLPLFGFFTRLPVGTAAPLEAVVAAFPLVPMVGWATGAFGAVFVLVLAPVLPPAGLAAVLLALVVGLTGLNQTDGLLDLGDGLMVHGDAEKRLRVMHDHSAGVGAIGATLFTYLLSYGALMALLQTLAGEAGVAGGGSRVVHRGRVQGGRGRSGGGDPLPPPLCAAGVVGSIVSRRAWVRVRRRVRAAPCAGGSGRGRSGHRGRRLAGMAAAGAGSGRSRVGGVSSFCAPPTGCSVGSGATSWAHRKNSPGRRCSLRSVLGWVSNRVSRRVS